MGVKTAFPGSNIHSLYATFTLSLILISNFKKIFVVIGVSATILFSFTTDKNIITKLESLEEHN